MTDMKMPVRSEKDGKKTKQYVEPTAAQVDEIVDKAAPVATRNVANVLKYSLGVNILDMKDAVPSLRRRLRDPEIDNVQGVEPIPADKKQLYPGQTERKTHRYTIDVPDEGEYTVLNLGHGDPDRELPDAGISARTKSHIHFHTKESDSASMIALGGKTQAARHQIMDPKDALGANSGISAITNGHLWAESQGVANFASYADHAILRAHIKDVRVQADAASVEIGARSKVAIGGIEGVNIVSGSDVTCGENEYGKGFESDVVKSTGKVAGKDLVTMLDIISASVTAVKGFSDTDWFYQKGTLSQEKKANDKGKLVVDAVKALSSIGRFVAGKVVGGQVKIAADNFASVTGMLGASMYGHLSASVSSLLSASVVGGTASLKGLNWTSVWAANGVSVRTVHGSASVRSENGKVTLSAKDEIAISSRKGVNIGGDKYAELKCGNGPVYVAGTDKAAVCVGGSAGMGLIIIPDGMFMGTVSDADSMSKVKRKLKTGVQVTAADDAVRVLTKGASIRIAKKDVEVKGKKAHIL